MVKDNCETCKIMLEKYRSDELSVCSICGHYFLTKDEHCTCHVLDKAKERKITKENINQFIEKLKPEWCEHSNCDDCDDNEDCVLFRTIENGFLNPCELICHKKEKRVSSEVCLYCDTENCQNSLLYELRKNRIIF